jgi:hypothetical protein
VTSAAATIDWPALANIPWKERAPSRELPWYCDSCSASLFEHPGPADRYCFYCSDERGNLRPREEVAGIIARWMQGWQPGISTEEAAERAARYMDALPAWSRS